MKAQGAKAIESAGNGPLRAVTGSLPRAGSITGGCLQHDIFMHSGKKKKKKSGWFSGRERHVCLPLHWGMMQSAARIKTRVRGGTAANAAWGQERQPGCLGSEARRDDGCSIRSSLGDSLGERGRGPSPSCRSTLGG